MYPLPEATKPTLVYFPGIDGTGRLLHRQAGLYENFDVRCITYPQDRCATYEDLAQLGAAALTNGGGTVVAESFGGAVALWLALRRPDLIHRLVLVNTFAYYSRKLFIWLFASASHFLPRRPSPAWARYWRGKLFFAPDISRDQQDAWWERTADVPLWAYGVRVRRIQQLDLRPHLNKILAPAIVLVSTNDRIVPPEAGRTLVRGLRHSRLIETAAGHAALIHPSVDLAAILAGQ